jgi:hypothetical protein
MQLHNQLLIHTYAVGRVVMNDHIQYCKAAVHNGCC